jgi:hypothetical protein
MHTYKKHIYNFFTYVCLGTHILKTYILIFHICMSEYIYTKNTYINFSNMFKYKKNIYEIITYVLLGTHIKNTYINFLHMFRQKKGAGAPNLIVLVRHCTPLKASTYRIF